MPIDAPWVRLAVYTGAIEIHEAVAEGLRRLGRFRLAVAEDNDDFGIRWAVLEGDGGSVRTVHRRYLLNADPSDADETASAIEELDGDDPRTGDVTGAGALLEAAALFGADAAAMTAAEERSVSAWEDMGLIGTPFYWWDALGLPWPDDSIGVAPIEL